MAYPSRNWLLVFALLICPGASLSAAQITIDFEGLSDSTIVNNQYSGLSFSNAIILTSGISLNEFEFPPHSGVNVVSDNNGPLSVSFATPITSFSAYFTYVEPLSIAGFNAGNKEVASATSPFSSNDALFGEPGSSPNELLQISFANGISSVTITGDPAGGSFVMDDLTYTTGTSSVPEPGSLALLLPGILILLMRRSRT